MPTKLEEYLRKDGDAFYRRVLESLQDYAVFTIDLNDRVATWTPAAEKMFGYTEDEAIGRDAAFIFTQPDQEQDEPGQELQDARETGHGVDERWHVRDDGSLFWAQGMVNPLSSDDGELIGYVKIVRDLTARKIAENEIQRLNETLEQRVAARTEQVRAMAQRLSRVEDRERRRIASDLHDHLAQLLVSSRMRLSLVKPADDPSGELIGAIEQTLIEAMQYVRTLIAQLRPTVLYEQGLEAAIDWLAEHMESRFRLKVNVDSDGEPKPVAEDVSVVLFQAVRELLVNAAKHAQTEEANVRMERQDEQIRITVSDSGVGFRMLEPARSDDPPTSQGYGLFSVREHVRLVGGEIDIHSEPGQGTRIRLTVPLQSHPASEAEQADASV